MALVKEFKSKNVLGATIRIYDDCYRDLTPEQLKERRKEISRVILRIDRNYQLRKLREREEACLGG